MSIGTPSPAVAQRTQACDVMMEHTCTHMCVWWVLVDLRDGVVSNGLVTKTQKVVVYQRSEEKHVAPVIKNSIKA